MRTSSGELMRWSSDPKSPYYNRLFLDLGKPEVVAYLVDNIVSTMLKYRETGYAFSGVALDNCLFTHWWRLKNKQHPEGWPYSQDSDEWMTVFFDYIDALYAALKKEGLLLYLNHTLEARNDSDEKHWPRLLTIADGFMHEGALINTNGKTITVPEILRSIKHYQRIKRAGKQVWLWCDPKTDEQEQLCVQVAELVGAYLTLPIKEQ